LQLERWRDASSSKEQQQQQQQQDRQQPYQYSLQLLVPHGQLELGRRLITAMYSSSPDLSDLEAPELLQLLALAECCAVGKVVECAAAQLHKLTAQSMPFNIALAVFELPEACLALEAVQQLQQAAADKLQQELGDLEVVWGDKDKQEQLLGLPLGALLQLLRDERTRVASEDTAVYTALRWLNEAGKQHGQQQQEQQQLAKALRLPHCTATFLSSLAGPGTSLDQDMAWVYDNNPKLLVEVLAVIGKGEGEQCSWVYKVHPERIALGLPPRPVSAVSQLQFEWALPLTELEQLVARPPGEEGAPKPSSSRRWWQGRQWWLTLDYEPDNGRVTAQLCKQGAPAFVIGSIGLFCQVDGGCWYAVEPINAEYTLTHTYGVTMVEWGPGATQWPQVKAWLMSKELVYHDDCLHLRLTIPSLG
jgi:hypothetical protein